MEVSWFQRSKLARFHYVVLTSVLVMFCYRLVAWNERGGSLSPFLHLHKSPPLYAKINHAILSIAICWPYCSIKYKVRMLYVIPLSFCGTMLKYSNVSFLIKPSDYVLYWLGVARVQWIFLLLHHHTIQALKTVKTQIPASTGVRWVHPAWGNDHTNHI